MDRPSSGWTARLLAVTGAVVVLLAAAPAWSAVLTVTDTGDSGDGTCDSSCTLRDAVGDASSGDTITFGLSGTAPWEIALGSTLTVAADVTIDGLTCCGVGNTNTAAQGFTHTLAIRVSGTADPLLALTGAVTLIGLNVDGSNGDGIVITGNGSTVRDCYVGTAIDGTAGTGNSDSGIVIDAADNVTIGPYVVASGNGDSGILADGDVDFLTVKAVIAGLQRDASAVLANGDDGLTVDVGTSNATELIVGGATAADGNVFSGNSANGLYIEGDVDGDSGFDCLVGNNIVGTDGAVTLDRGNTFNGIAFEPASNSSFPNQIEVIDNVVSGNSQSGIRVAGASLMGFAGNAIGTDPTGTLSLPNTGDGLYFVATNAANTADHLVGETHGGAVSPNLIANNGGDGIRIQDDGNKTCDEVFVSVNSIYDNGDEGIDLEGSGVTGDGATLPAALDCGGDGAYGNGGIGGPTLTTATLSGGTLTVTGTTCGNFDVDLYLSSAGGGEFGQPMVHLESETADGAGAFTATHNVTFGAGVGGGAYVTALAHAAEGTTQAAANLIITAPCDADGDGADATGGCGGTDCDDTDVEVYPGAVEVCDGVDSDCDGSIDEDSDADGDGATTCGPNGIQGDSDDDCDDAVATIFPGATEVCDAVDQDCDTVIDNTFDVDGDGFTTCGADGDVSLTADNDCDDGVATTFPGATELCNLVDDDCSGAPDADEVDADGDGEMICAGDCDDAATAINTSATEVCDIVDNNCDGNVDEGFDVDGDGFTTCGADGDLNTPGDNDCDDTIATINPSGTETCNQADDDCDGDTDEDFDADGDGYPAGVACTAAWGSEIDCNDQSASVNPGALELCGDGIDNDCDALIDEDVDLDGDTYTNCDGDCDDTDPLVNPGATEVCDGVDTDCDGTVPADETDDDGDEFNECAGLDCDDTAASIYPGASEICDGADSDCDGTTPADETDDDGDGLNECGDNDCDDADATVGPGLEELCDGIDNVCDGSIPDDELDDDEDFVSECEGDCDDGDDTINPSATEDCDGVDQNCDGTVDDGFDADGDGATTCGGDGVDGTEDDDCDDADATVNPSAEEACGDGVDQDCDGSDLACAATADVTLAPVPPPEKGCAASVAGGSAPGLGLLLGFGFLLGARRRRRSLAPVLLLSVFLSGCVVIEAGTVQTWWGALPDDGGAVTLEAGGSFAAAALVQPVDPELVDGRQLLQVVLAGDLLPSSCALQETLMAEAALIEADVAESAAAGVASADVAAWACQDLRGAAREAFGGDGWRAVHALVDPVAGALSPATGTGDLLDILTEGTYVARMVDLDAGGALAPTPVADACATRVQALIDSGATLEEGALLGAALAALDHDAAADDQLDRADERPVLDVGLSLPAGLEAGSRPDQLRLATFLGDDAGGSYPNAVVATIGDPIPSEPCAISPKADVLAIWPELTPQEALP